MGSVGGRRDAARAAARAGRPLRSLPARLRLLQAHPRRHLRQFFAEQELCNGTLNDKVVDKVVDKLVNKLVNRQLQAGPLLHADLDRTMRFLINWATSELHT